MGKLADNALEPTLHTCGVALTGKHRRLFRGEIEQFPLRLVRYVAKGGVRRQPLEKITLVQVASSRQLTSGTRACFFQRPVNTGLIPDVRQQNTHRPGGVAEHFTSQCLQLGLIQLSLKFRTHRSKMNCATVDCNEPKLSR